jgi:hypothetical protein
MSLDVASPAPAAAPEAAAPAAPSFERQLDSKLSGGGGSALPADVATQASTAYGADMSGVRVHADDQSGQMAESKGFQAFSYGQDVFFKPDAYNPSSEDGRFVMMHELAHVAQSGGERAAGVQGKAEFGDSSEAMEVDADRAAETALVGGSYQVQQAPLKVRGFGATATRDRHTGARNPNDIVHENQTLNAANRAEFSDRDANMIYSGNWQRDMNQFLIPTFRLVAPLIFSAMDLVHTLHFGFPIGGNTEGMVPGRNGGRTSGAAAIDEFGTYDPVEHLDNPGGLTGENVSDQDGGREGADSAARSRNAGDATEAYAHADTRYAAQYQAIMKAAGAVEGAPNDPIVNRGAETNAAFFVDQSGIPVYMQTSRTQLIQRLKQGIDLAPQNRDRALRMGGEALHVMQDYYAHSNFCEIALNLMIDGVMEHPAPGQQGQSRATGRTLVDVLNLSQLNPALADPATTRHHLNSYVHRRTGQGVDRDRNMTTGPNGGGREVMATGTFTLEDTAHSIKEKVGLALRQINPFAEGPAGPSEKAMRMLQWFETNPQYFPFNPGTWAQRIGTALQGVMPIIEGTSSVASTVMSAHGTVSAAMDRGWGSLQGAWHRAWGDNAAATAAETQGSADAARTEQQSQARQEAIRNFTTALNGVSQQMASGGSLTSLYKWTYDVTSAVTLASLARMIPVVGNDAAVWIDAKVRELKEDLRREFEAAWNNAVQQFTAEFNAAVALALGSSEVSDSTGAQGMTQPTHTDIAKDFDSHQHGTEDRFSLIEEVGEFVTRVGGLGRAVGTGVDIISRHFDRAMSGQAGVIDSLRGAVNDVVNEVTGEAQREHDHEREDGHADGQHQHRHQHRHAGAWLAPLAHSLATQSSEAILRAWRPGVAEGRAPAQAESAKAATETAVNNWFKHPEDCRGLWEGHFTSMLQGQGMAPAEAQAIREELARRIALPPSQQSTNDESTTGHDDRHRHHDHGDADHGDHHSHNHGPNDGHHGGETPHDHDDHRCGTGCTDFQPHGMDNHQCSVHCEAA